MRSTLVLTVVGADRPGLVEAVSAKALAHDANWEASRMARLAGRFAGVLLVTVENGRIDALEADLLTLEQDGLRVVVERCEPADEQPSRRLRLDVVGADRSGVVREISGALAQRGVNVHELSTEVTEAAMAGGMLFRMQAVLACPPVLAVDELRVVLEQFGNDLMVEITLDEE